MFKNSRLTQLLSASALGLTACATLGDDVSETTSRRDEALEILQLTAGAPVSLEVNARGTTRVLGMTPRFAVPVRASDPAEAALNFLASHRDAFLLSASEAAEFVVKNVDVEQKLDMTHVTLQRTFNGIPVYQGAITVHMDRGNNVFRVLGDEFYRVTQPTNRMVLSARDAALAAGRALGVALSPTLMATEGQSTTFSSPGTLDPVKVEPRIFEVAPGDNRYAHQVVLSWANAKKEQQLQLALVDAADGSLLANYSLVETFTGRVFNVAAQPTANMTVDTRTVVSFDGNPAASPQGWVGAARNTVGNNAVAQTDLNANNAFGTNEIRPTANASDSFDFAFSPTQNASLFQEAAVANAFFLTNDFHDRTYLLGFTETSRNFQTNNFGRGGAQNDPVNVDVQDGGGTNNANFGTPPDGSSPRMQMFLFTITGGATEDGDFDPTVIYHEYAHGLSNRLVGGGTTTCLRGIQSGGMGEGWSDFMAATFLNNPVIGAYVTGDAINGIRRAPMDNSPFTYANIQDGTMTEVHDAGEIWAATLFDARKTLGATVIDQLVVSGMKLTPCNPTMLQARDAIISADAQINGGANRCALFTAFAGRLMGTGASSATHNTTTGVITSTAVPPECDGGGGGGATTVFTDDFEIDRGWTVNPAGTDNATLGQWQRANPEATASSGTKQQGTTTSGVNNLVTGAAAGASVGANDLDGGVTSVRSPAIAIPATGTTTLSLQFYFAHLNNSSSADFFRVQVVGATTSTVIEELGTAADDDAAFVARSVNISAFAGQTVRIVITAADNATGSLVEAAVDDVLITNQ